jgi:hypothetical protein
MAHPRHEGFLHQTAPSLNRSSGCHPVFPVRPEIESRDGRRYKLSDAAALVADFCEAEMNHPGHYPASSSYACSPQAR